MPFPSWAPCWGGHGFLSLPPQPIHTPDDPHKQQAWHTSLHPCLEGIWPKDKCYQTKYRTGPWLGGWGEMQLNSRARFWLPWLLSWYRIHLQCRRPGFDPSVGKIPWRRERLPTPVFWHGEFHGLYSSWGHKESDTTEQLFYFTSLLVIIQYLFFSFWLISLCMTDCVHPYHYRWPNFVPQ